MAPILNSRPANASSLPLADYFFIAGVESSQIFDEKTISAALAAPPVDATIEEDIALETVATSNKESNRNSATSVAGGFSNLRFSYEKRRSAGSTITLGDNTAGGAGGLESNRSSATIRAVQANGPGLSDFDFDSALRKFAAERESFLDEIRFDAGAVVQQSRPKHRVRTQRIVNEDANIQKSAVGSIRRRLGTMNSLKRQPSSARQGELSLSV